jgi:hypothetical protein
MRFLPAAAIVIAAISAAALITLSNFPGFIAGGSDATAEIFAPSLPVQAIAFLVFLVALAICATPRCKMWRLPSFAFASILLLLITHRVDMDGGRGRLTDIWLTIPIQTFNFPPTDGPAASHARLRQSWAYTSITVPSAAPLILLTGIPPLSLNLSPLSQYWPP